jgi:23S rRNA pseudouridine1911/1915/1917 synthase
MKKYRVTEKAAGQRADVFLAAKYPNLSRSSVEKLFEEKLVSKGSQTAKAGQRLKPGEELKLDDRLLLKEPAPIKLPVIYEDDDVIVIDKPEGVLTHSKGAINHEATVATFIKPKLQELTDNNRAGIVHRLDRGTSGLIIAAKNPAAQAKLQKQFSQRTVKKTYLAIVEGNPAEQAAIIDIPIERNPRRPQVFRVGSGGKPAQTEYRVLKQITKDDKVYSLLELKPKTGRTHQLRVHLAHIGHPVVGDKLYGKTTLDHLYLHAASLELTLPNSQRRIFNASVPDYFTEFENGR